MGETNATPELTEEKDPFSPADVLTISMTRARVELMRKEVADAADRINKLDEGDSFYMAPVRTVLEDILFYLNTAVLTGPAPEFKNAPYPDVNDEKPLTTEEPTTEPEPTEEPAPLRAHIDFEAPGEFMPTPEPEIGQAAVVRLKRTGTHPADITRTE